MKYWRNCGIRILVHLDDGIGIGKGRMLATQASELVQKWYRVQFF